MLLPSNMCSSVVVGRSGSSSSEAQQLIYKSWMNSNKGSGWMMIQLLIGGEYKDIGL